MATAAVLTYVEATTVGGSILYTLIEVNLLMAAYFQNPIQFVKRPSIISPARPSRALSTRFLSSVNDEWK